MTKKIKKISLFILFSTLLLSIFLLIPSPVSTFADTTKSTYDYAKENYYKNYLETCDPLTENDITSGYDSKFGVFSPGAIIHTKELYYLGFYFKGNTLPLGTKTEYTFTILRLQADGTYIPVGVNVFSFTVLSYDYTDTTLSYCSVGESFNVDVDAVTTNKGFINENFGFTFKVAPFTSYKIALVINQYKATKTLGGVIVGSDVKYSKMTTSDTRSYALVLNNMIDNTGVDLSQEYDVENSPFGVTEEVYKSWQDIHNGIIVDTDITLSYLEEIENSFFAVKKTVTLNVKRNNLTGEIFKDEVLSKLNLPNFKCYIANFKKFDEISEKVYNVDYLKAITFTAETSDGNTFNYYLDINNTYADVFNPFVETQTLPDGASETFYNSMLNDYPEIEDIPKEDLYGFFGFVMIPNTYTINSALAEIFGETTKFDGVLKHKYLKLGVTAGDYAKLLSDYNYGWLSIVWNEVAGFVAGTTADCYLLIAEPTKEEGRIKDKQPDYPKIFDLIKGFFDENKIFGYAVVSVAGVYLLKKLGLLPKEKNKKRRK